MAYTTIDNPELYFQTKIYTGDGNDDRNIVFDVTDTSMQPNMLISARRDSSDNMSLYDSVRGDGKELRTAGTSAELDRSDNIQALSSNGFQVGADGQVNASGGTYVSWAWKAGGSASTNENGSTDSSVSVSTDAGFSIVSYTGAGATTYGHGLGATPNVIIIKKRSSDSGDNSWFVYHDKVITAGASNKSFMLLDTTDALGANGSATTFTSVSSTTFGVGTDDIIGESSHTFIAYCFAEKQGYSKFNKFTGNGANNFIYTGFSPAWVMIRKTDDTHDWHIFDNKRDAYNPRDSWLEANTANAEATSSNYVVDFLSNGFKTGSGSGLNGSGETFIYMAFAEAPFVTSSGVPATAR